MIIDKRTKRVKNRGKVSKARKIRVRRTKKSRVNRRNRRTKKTKRNKKVQRGGMMDYFRYLISSGRDVQREPVQTRTKLEAAQVRLTFAKILISDSRLVDGVDDNILKDIGYLLNDELLKVNEIETKWDEWSSAAKLIYSHINFPPLSITIGEEPPYNFTFADLKPGNRYKVVGGNYKGQSPLTTKIFTFDSIEVNVEDHDIFHIKLINSELLLVDITFCANQMKVEERGYELGWYLKRFELPLYIKSFTRL